MPKGALTIEIDPGVKARLFAECEIRGENDHVHWTVKRLVTQWAMRTLPKLSSEDEQRIAARCNGHHSTPKHKRQKVKPAA